MAIERHSRAPSLIDVLDRVLDKGMVIDAWMCVSLAGIDLMTVEARVIVASIDTYLRFADDLAVVQPVARPTLARPGGEAALPADGEVLPDGDVGRS